MNLKEIKDSYDFNHMRLHSVGKIFINTDELEWLIKTIEKQQKIINQLNTVLGETMPVMKMIVKTNEKTEEEKLMEKFYEMKTNLEIPWLETYRKMQEDGEIK